MLSLRSRNLLIPVSPGVLSSLYYRWYQFELSGERRDRTSDSAKSIFFSKFGEFGRIWGTFLGIFMRFDGSERFGHLVKSMTFKVFGRICNDRRCRMENWCSKYDSQVDRLRLYTYNKSCLQGSPPPMRLGGVGNARRRNIPLACCGIQPKG